MGGAALSSIVIVPMGNINPRVNAHNATHHFNSLIRTFGRVNVTCNNNWFQISGFIILRGDTPIASTPFEREAVTIINALTDADKGQRYACISANGHWSTKKDKEKPND